MTSRMPIDELARDASDALGRATDRLTDPPPVATLQARLERRRRRRVGAATVAAALAVTVAVGSLVTGGGEDPVIVDRPTPQVDPTETGPTPDVSEPAGSAVTRDGWTLVDDPAVFGGPGPQVVSAGAVTGEVTVLVGLDAATADDADAGGRTRPAVWRSDGADGWQRDPGGSFEIGSRWDEAGVLVRDVAAGSDGRLVAVGYANFEPAEQPIAWVSTDGGVRWVEADLGGEVDGSMEAVTWTGERFVAVGSTDAGPTSWTSSDGTAWLRQPPVTGEGSFHDITLHRDRLVAVSVIGDSSQMWVADATGQLDWESVELPASGTLSALSSADDTLYAVGAVRPDGLDHDGILLTSPDGVTWQVDDRSESLDGPGDQLPADVLVDGDLVIVVGQSDRTAAIWTAADGGPFRLVDPDLLPEEGHVSTLLATPETILATGTVARDVGVPDVLLWTRQPATATTGAPVAACPASEPASFQGVPDGWEALDPPPFARARAATAWTGRQLLHIGGDSNLAGTRHDNVVAYDPTTGGWTCHTDAPFPVARGHVAWTGQTLYVWGGTAAATYQPDDGDWQQLPAPPADAPADPVAVAWAGDELIVWGSRSRTTPTASGVAYDPDTRQWRQLADAPLAINQGQAVWTGTELLIVGSELDGGNHSATSSAVGIAYDPAADRWRQLPPTGLSPQASSIAWTGSELIAWDYELTARSYDPTSDRWTDLPDLPLEFGECYPASAVLDDGRIFAWYCGQAALLDPDTGTWTGLDTPITTHWGRPAADGEVEQIAGLPVAAGDSIYFAGAAHEGHANALWRWQPSP